MRSPVWNMRPFRYHSVRWFAACLAIATFQYWGWTSMAKEDHVPIGLPDFLVSFAMVCLAAWFFLPQKRPCGFDRLDLGREEILRRLKRQPKTEARRYP